MEDLLANIAETVAARVKRSARRQMGGALLVGLALLFVGVAVIAGIAAIGVALAARWGVLAACLIIAAAAFVVALVLVAVVAQQAKAARRMHLAEREQWRQAMQAAKAMAPDLSAGKALLMATALGLIVGLTRGARKPHDN
jgi:uncharacterized membrane protein